MAIFANWYEIEQKLTSLETAVAGLRRDQAHLYGDMADQLTA